MTEKKITIKLSERAPVTIAAKEWPIVARGSWFSGEHECQANEEAFVRIRQHADGRAVVYGLRDRGPGGMPLSYRGTSAGYLLNANASSDEIVRAIRRVAGVLGHDLAFLADETIADLPAEAL